MARALPGGQAAARTAARLGWRRYWWRRAARTAEARTAEARAADGRSGGGRYGLSEHGTAMSEADVAGVAVDTRHWIAGRRVASPGTFTDLSPIDGRPLAEVARGGEAEVAAAVQAAHQAFDGWSQTPPLDRAAVLHAIGGGIEARNEDLSQGRKR